MAVERGAGEAARARLLALAAAHNKAVLAGEAIALLVAFGLGLAAIPLARYGRALAVPPLLAGALLGWRGVRLHGRIIRDLGPARGAAAEVAAALHAQGGASPLGELEARFPREDLLRALDFLHRLGLAWAERRAGGDVVVLDPARGPPLLA
jgi:hypothetical protein